MRKRQFVSSAAFTLVEILVVVVILGIAGAIIVPQIGSRDDRKVEAAARVIIADLIYAQNLAITQQSNHYVLFEGSPALVKYSVVRSTDMSVVEHPVNKTPYAVTFGSGGSSGMQQITVVSADFRGQSGTMYHTLGFDELGTPLAYTGTATEPMTSGSIVVRCGEHTLRVDVEPFTGQITVTAI